MLLTDTLQKEGTLSACLHLYSAGKICPVGKTEAAAAGRTGRDRPRDACEHLHKRPAH